MTLDLTMVSVSQTTAPLCVGRTLRLVWPESTLDEQPIRQGSCLPWRALMSADDNVCHERIQHIDQQFGRLVVAGLELDNSFESKHSDPVRLSWTQFKTDLGHMQPSYTQARRSERLSPRRHLLDCCLDLRQYEVSNVLVVLHKRSVINRYYMSMSPERESY
jgi:hypothetical protein